MVNKIIDGISIKLNKVFGDDYSIYSENVKQGFKEPCFFISPLRIVNNQKLINRSTKEYNFCIQYFPKSKESREYEINTVLESLNDNLDTIDHEDNIYYFDNLNGESVDGVLNYFMTTKVNIIKIKKEEEMFEQLNIQATTKEQ